MASKTLRCDAAAVVEHLAKAGAPALRAFVERQRWFAAKARGLGIVRVEDWAALRDDPPLVLLPVRADEARYLGRRLASGPFLSSLRVFQQLARTAPQAGGSSAAAQ